jgi:predicted RNase H-like nuclease (RuvC/YqgF family)
LAQLTQTNSVTTKELADLRDQHQDLTQENRENLQEIARLNRVIDKLHKEQKQMRMQFDMTIGVKDKIILQLRNPE